MDDVRNIILVLSGKGGVGKSSVALQLALSLWALPEKPIVAVLDIDLCGPSMPRMLGVDDNKVYQASAGWAPVYANDSEQRLKVMSIAFLLQNKDDAVVWRGPKKTAMIRQFLNDVCWGRTDYLIIDSPPGTSDEHITIVESLKAFNPLGAVLVTTPQAVALSDVRKELNFCVKVKLPVLGVVENMSGFICPTCSECSNLFSSGGGEAMAAEFKVDFLGRIPIDPSFVNLIEMQRRSSMVVVDDAKTEAESITKSYPHTKMFKAFAPIVQSVLVKCHSSRNKSDNRDAV